jgi:voltage-gated potassium channel
MKSAAIFGYNEYTLEIANALKSSYSDITIYVFDKELEVAKQSGFNVRTFDLSDDWSELEERYDLSTLIIFCVLQESAENIFLTISLRSVLSSVLIIALSQNQESDRKLRDAGANKTISITQTTASIISEMIERPFVARVLNDILYGKDALKIVQIEITDENSSVIGRKPAQIPWKREFGIIVLAVMKQDLKTSFLYTKSANQEALCLGDLLTVVGMEEDIVLFENKVGRRSNADWRDWSW